MNTAEHLKQHVSLLELVADLVEIDEVDRGQLGITVSGVKIDSREIEAGDLFIACFGFNHDARDYIQETITQGATAVLAESGGHWNGVQFIGDVPVIAVEKLSTKISDIAGRFYMDPSAQLSVFGITGTNGKTSCSQFIAESLAEFDYHCGIIGTLGYGSVGQLKETSLTTPDPVFTQRVLAEMVLDKVEPVVMEVSSVGLHQSRVAAVHFDTAIFTNLSRDHLDYHDSMEEYGDNKRKLFMMEGLRCAIVNLDDPFALSILNSIDSEVDIITYSRSNLIATVCAESLEFTESGFKARIRTPLGVGEIEGCLLGEFNFSNVLAVAAALIGYLPGRIDLTMEQLCKSLSRLSPVSGRMEIVPGPGNVTAVVDYAHTPDGLRSALCALREHYAGSVWCVFGCGGNRDQGKRPLMGEIAEAYADHIVIADDNPRKEDGDRIVQHILSGLTNTGQAVVIRDRAEAITWALKNAQAGDVVLVAGKGHETYQDIDGVRHMFSDVKQVRLAQQKLARKN